MHRLGWTLPLLLTLVGCDGKEPIITDDTGADTGDTEDTVDTGETGDTDSAETGETGDTAADRYGAIGRLGGAIVVGTDSYVGTEEWYFIGDKGDGDDICRIRVNLTNVGDPRNDCEAGGDTCNFAFDLVASNATIVNETDVGCAGTFGYDTTTVSDLDGSMVSYGFLHAFYGHADVLMVYTETEGWTAGTFATYDETTEEFGYDWQDGYANY